MQNVSRSNCYYFSPTWVLQGASSMPQIINPAYGWLKAPTTHSCYAFSPPSVTCSTSNVLAEAVTNTTTIHSIYPPHSPSTPSNFCAPRCFLTDEPDCDALPSPRLPGIWQLSLRTDSDLDMAEDTSSTPRQWPFLIETMLGSAWYGPMRCHEDFYSCKCIEASTEHPYGANSRTPNITFYESIHVEN